MLVTKNLSHNVVGGASSQRPSLYALQNDCIMIQYDYNYIMEKKNDTTN